MESPNITYPNISDCEEASVAGKVVQTGHFEDGNEVYYLDDVEGNEGRLNIWSDEAAKYDLNVAQWELIRNAMGNNSDDQMIDLNSGNLVDIPLVNVHKAVGNVVQLNFNRDSL